MSPRKQCLQDTTDQCTYELTEPVAANTGAERVRARQGPCADGGSGHGIPSLTQELSAIGIPLQRETISSDGDSPSMLSHTSEQALCPAADVKIKNPQGYFCRLLSSIPLFRLFCLTVLLLVYYNF